MSQLLALKFQYILCVGLAAVVCGSVRPLY